MNTLLLRLSIVILGVGMLGAAACSGCSQQPTDTGASSAAMQPTSYTCGFGTHREGNACVANATSGTSTQSTPKTLNPNSGN